MRLWLREEFAYARVFVPAHVGHVCLSDHRVTIAHDWCGGADSRPRFGASAAITVRNIGIPLVTNACRSELCATRTAAFPTA